MFEVGWTEMLVIAIVMIVVVGPKDLPKMLRTFGRTTSKLRAMAGDFRKQFDEALKEAELDDVKSVVDDARKLSPAAQLREAMNPMQKAAADIRAGLDGAMNPKPAEPLKPGPSALPGEEPAPVAATDAAAAIVPDPSAPAPVAVAVADPAAPAPVVSATGTATVQAPANKTDNAA